jgi:transcription antitermination factor NusG
MEQEEEKWFALYTKSRFEKKTGQLLTEKGFEVYVPLVKTIKQWSDRKKIVEEPLFRSYLFFKTSISKLPIIKQTYGAVYIVSFNNKPAIIPDEQIKNLQLLLSSNEKFEISDEKFTTGEIVEVIRGSLQGLKGTFLDYRGNKTISIRIDAINQCLMVLIPPLWVKKI